MASTGYKLRGDGVPLNIADGGTNAGTALNNNRMILSAAGAIVEGAALTNGQVFLGSTGAAPVAASITAGTGITVTPGAGTLTISTSGASGVTGSGVATRVAYWDTASSISSDSALFWDPTNDRLGIGTSTPTFMLNIEKSSNSAVSGTYPGLLVENTFSPAGNRIADGLWRTDDGTGTKVDVKIVSSGYGSGSSPFLDNIVGGGVGTATAFPFMLVTNDAVRAYISSTGLVGIGTTSPTLRLSITTSAAEDGIVIRNDAADGDQIIVFDDTGTRNWTIGNDDGDGQKFKFGNGGATFAASTKVMTITPNTGVGTGFVGIGTESPTYMLHISRDSNSTVAGRYPGILIENQIATVAAFGEVVIRTDGGAGDVDTKLFCDGSGNSTFTQNRVGGAVGTSTTNKFFLVTDNTVRATIDTVGKMGIGTVAPALHLDVVYTSTTADGLFLNNLSSATNADVIIHMLASTEEWTFGIDQSDAGKLKFCSGATLATNTVMTLDNDFFKVGIGTSAAAQSPVYTIDVQVDSNSSTPGTYPAIRVNNQVATVAALAEFMATTDSGSGDVSMKMLSNGGNIGGNLSVVGGYVGTTTTHPTVITTDSVIRAYFDTSSRMALGYGNTAPTFALDVQFDTATEDGLQLRNNNANADIIVGFNDGATRVWTIGNDDSASQFKFSTTAIATGTVMALSTSEIIGNFRLNLSSISAGSPNMVINATSDTPAVTWAALNLFPPSAAPAGYMEILVGGSPRYVPFWA